MIKYRMNLVKSLREAERRDSKYRAWITLLLLLAFASLAGGGYFSYNRITGMQKTLGNERAKLKAIEAEYNTYHAAQSIIDKADIELLNQIQANRIYWTKKLEAMARHLPEEEPASYWITKFGYWERSKTFTVSGYGYITSRQEQLLALDEYLTKLRADSNYKDVFSQTFLKSAVRSDEGSDAGKGAELRERVSFEYASLRKGAARK